MLERVVLRTDFPVDLRVSRLDVASRKIKRKESYFPLAGRLKLSNPDHSEQYRQHRSGSELQLVRALILGYKISIED